MRLKVQGFLKLADTAQSVKALETVTSCCPESKKVPRSGTIMNVRPVDSQPLDAGPVIVVRAPSGERELHAVQGQQVV
jgi:hypothetical protein